MPKHTTDPSAAPGDTEHRIRKYFFQNSRQLLAAADSAICDHPGLIGSHREQLQRLYLDSILPSRFSAGRGMVYGQSDDRSHEADIVIWDSQNFSQLPLADHAFFFAESVRMIIECKSTWSDDAFRDVCHKAAAAHAIAPMRLFKRPKHILFMQMMLPLLKRKAFKFREPLGRIRTAAIFFRGGQSLTTRTANVKEFAIDDEWPDLILLLEAGIVIHKVCTFSADYKSGKGSLVFCTCGDDALLVFTARLLELIAEESCEVEETLDLLDYVPALEKKEERITFTPQRDIVEMNVKIEKRPLE